MSKLIQPTRLEALMLVRSHYKSDAEMAEAFEVSQPTIWRWINQSKQMPVEKGEVLRAERLTGVSRHHLRPDIYPVETVSIPASVIDDDASFCVPILTARMLAGHGNIQAVLPRREAPAGRSAKA